MNELSSFAQLSTLTNKLLLIRSKPSKKVSKKRKVTFGN